MWVSQGSREYTTCRSLFLAWGGRDGFSALGIQYPVLSREKRSPQLPVFVPYDRMPLALLEESVVVPGLGEVETGSPFLGAASASPETKRLEKIDSPQYSLSQLGTLSCDSV